jgi:hypothetical protein
VETFNGLGIGFGGIARLSTARTRSISAENFSGAPGAGGMATEGTGAEHARGLGQGWKVSPSVRVAPHSTFTLGEIAGPGAIQHLWLTTHRQHWRQLLFRCYWEGDERPAVEVPVGDFFCQGWGEFSQVNSLPVAVNPHGGFNSYWPMPFRQSARLTLENISDQEITVYFQIDYTLTDLPEGMGYLHAHWRRSNPLAYQTDHLLLEGVRGGGHYVGTYLAWGVNNSGWWGEGEIKFFMDGDQQWPSICGTGTEDYFGGAWNFDVPGQGYTPFSTPFLGMPQVLRPDGLYRSQQRFGMYRWHVMDPIRFADDLRVTIQALGWRKDRRYLPLQDDIASTAFFYGAATSNELPPTPTADALEVI